MLSRSKGRHKITFQQLPLSLNPKAINILIIGIGLVSSLAAFLMILDFAGLKPNSLLTLNISYWTKVSVTDILAGLANGLVSAGENFPTLF